MGTVYVRGSKLWLGFTDAYGKRQAVTSGLRVGRELEAKAMLAALEQWAEEKPSVATPTAVPRVADYLEQWRLERRRRGVMTADDDEARIRLHALELIGQLTVAEVKPKHIREIFIRLRARMGSKKGQLAPKSVRNIYGALHRLFADAMADDLVPSNPVMLRRGELPANVDKNPLWRKGAVFTRAEAEQLISDEESTFERRVLFALALLTGARVGELAALTWDAVDFQAVPLGMISIHSAYNRKMKIVKGTKTGNPREVPIHPTLAGLLKTWKLSGWAARWGHSPRPTDLVLPGPLGTFLQDTTAREWLHADLLRLGLRERRFHDFRRTLIFTGASRRSQPRRAASGDPQRQG